MIKKMQTWAEAKATFLVGGEDPVLLRDNGAYAGRKLLPARVSARWIWQGGGGRAQGGWYGRPGPDIPGRVRAGIRQG